MPEKKKKAGPPPRPTLGALRAHSCWTWVTCANCGRRSAVPYAPLIIRFGADASSEILDRYLTCRVCGKAGPLFQIPAGRGLEPFPVAFAATRPFYGGKAGDRRSLAPVAALQGRID